MSTQNNPETIMADLLISDTKILTTPIVDNHEPLVNMRDENIIAIGPSPEIPNNTDYTYIRKTVYEKLKQAQNLLPKGLRFCLYEGYRSLDLQKKLYDAHFENIRKQYPNWNERQLFEETTKLIAPVTNLDRSMNTPPHSTGAAIDVYLIDDHGHAVDMGIHPQDWMADLDGLISKTDSHHISKEAQDHRKIMSTALEKEGFVNYPFEYWHWSYGDRYWAYHKKETHAIYASTGHS